jgi:hypothetical protein
MRKGSKNPWGPLEYVLLILLLALVLYTVFSLFWPAIKLFYDGVLQK